MTPDESIELANIVRKHIQVVGCDFPVSLININVVMIHLTYPPVFIYVHQMYEYKCAYIPCLINKSCIVLKGRHIF